MEMPKIKTVLKDEQNDIAYAVLAYRQLSRDELVLSVRAALSNMKKSKRPKRGQKLQIVSVIGADD